MSGSSAHWNNAEMSAEIGYPIPSNARLRALKRLIGKLIWPFMSRQVVVNRSLLAELEVVRERLDGAEYRLDRTEGDLGEHSAVLSRHETAIASHETSLGQQLEAIESEQTKSEALGGHLQLVNRAIGEIQQKSDDIDRYMKDATLDLLRQVDVMKDMANLGHRQVVTHLNDALADLRGEFADIRRAVDARAHSLEQIRLQLAQLDLFLTEVRRAFPTTPSAAQLATIPSGFSGLELVFEEVFRGPEQVIRERVSAYVDDLLDLPGGAPVLDVGCGRGELLEVLRNAGIRAYGIDTSIDNIATCSAKGLDARHEDARTHLQGIPEATIGAVTAIHVVEHLEVDALIELIELAARAVKPGGMLIFETPNPENVIVGANTFYLDPTHRRPLPPSLLAFLVESRGFGHAEIRRLHRAEQSDGVPVPKGEDPWSEELAPVARAVNEYLFAPLDYAVIGRRP